MGKSKRTQKEFSREQRLIKENSQLKQKISQLRKALARLDLDRHDTVKSILEEHYDEHERFNQEDLLKKMQKEWQCHHCSDGYLEILLFNKLNKTYYVRACNNCTNRTKSQIYSPDVRGILKKSS